MTLHIEIHTAWHKSSFSAEDANCVESAFGNWCESSPGGPVEVVQDTWCESPIAHPVAAVRDSKNPGAPYLVFPADVYRAFIAAQR